MKEYEIDDLMSLVKQFQTDSEEIDIFEEFYVGYCINQINKEFDLLRIGKNSVINIELKGKNTGEKIKEQLIKNKYYLSFLEKEIFNVTYVTSEQSLLYLNKQEELEEVHISFVIDKLYQQKIEEIEDINKLFNPSNYLISPFNSTSAFIKGQYFLTHQQNEIKKSIINLKAENSACFASIQGAAGTGKTLLTYDIAKEYIKNHKKVIIFHCGSLNTGHINLRQEHLWIVDSIKNLKDYKLSEYDIIIIDEVQRIYKYQLDKILEQIMNINIKCIFSYDPKQCLASWEIKSNIPEYIMQRVSPKTFHLTEKIRTNKEISSFIKNLFDLSKKNPCQKYTNINIQYFSNARDAQEYIDMLNNRGWKVINYTPSRYDSYPYDSYQIYGRDSAHKVIGQEYDKVIAVIDRYFYYNDEGKLDTKGYTKTPYYHPTKMLFQIMTRTRKKLTIVIIKNEVLLKQCMQILNPNK